MNKKIQFKDLSFPLKTAVVISYIIAGFWGFSFIVGFIIGIGSVI